MKKEHVFVLGAQDPEMREIEKVLTRHHFKVLHAGHEGWRCNAGNAYSSNHVGVLDSHNRFRIGILHPNAIHVFVECNVRDMKPDVRMDHHNPGDPGFSMPPERFLEGSSLAQVLNWLGQEPSSDQKMLAAADHCLSAAYQGECPGVDPEELLFMRTSWQALISKRGLGEVMGNVVRAAKECKSRWNPETGEAFFKDPTRMPPDLPEGSAYAGVPIRYRSLSLDGQLKEMIKGASPDHIQRFMNEHSAKGHQTYGNPHRGYAGAYVSS